MTWWQSSQLRRAFRPPAGSIGDLVLKLGSRFVGERLEAEARLREMGPAAAGELLKLIEQEQQKLKRRRTAYFTIAGAFGAFAVPAVAYCIYMASSGGPAAGAWGGAIGGILGGGGGGILGGLSWLLVPSQLQMLASYALSRVDDVRAVGVLAEALSAHFLLSEKRGDAGLALVRLLPQLGPEHADLLTAQQRACLYRALGPVNIEKEPQLVLAIVRALRHIGMQDSIAPLERLLEIPPAAPDARELRAAAADSLEAIRIRVAGRDLADSLVRPVTSADAGQEMLLRPHAGGAPEEEDLLLRASADRSPQ